MYKALFELSADRADFVGKLFSKARPDGLTEKSTAKEIFDAYAKVRATEELYKKNLDAIQAHLTNTRHFELSEGDVAGVEYVYSNFYKFGPEITYNSSSGGGGFGGRFVTYSALMTADDGAGVSRSFLGNEENFKFLKDLQSRNLLVPVVGNFVGPKAIRAVGKYVKEAGGTVSAFYLSNVEQYLVGVWSVFCANAAALPLDETSTFIRSVRGNGGLESQLGEMLPEVSGCAAGR
jgi:hypothetical protein